MPVQKTMPTKCLFPSFCWATSRVQWYLSILSFTSLLFFALLLQALYTLNVTGMCDICAFSSEVKEVDVSGVLFWLLAQFLPSTSHFPYISYYSNWFPLFFLLSDLSTFSYFLPPFLFTQNFAWGYFQVMQNWWFHCCKISKQMIKGQQCCN